MINAYIVSRGDPFLEAKSIILEQVGRALSID